MSQQFSYRLERAEDEAAIEHLHELAFGPGRYARTAFRIRERAAHEPGLSHVAVNDGLVGPVRLTPVRIGETKALLLGPVAVHPAFAGQGAGRALMRRAMDGARDAGASLVVLVGDLAYYAPFGFARVPQGRIVFPGPVDPARILAAELAEGALAGATGAVHPRPADGAESVVMMRRA